MEKEVYNMRVIPFVRFEKRTKRGKVYEEAVDNFTREERENMSCATRILWEDSENRYVAEEPLVFRQGTGIRWFLCYVYDELTKEEQEKYYDRSIVIPMTRESVVKIYGEKSKSLFGKIRSKKRK